MSNLKLCTLAALLSFSAPSCIIVAEAQEAPADSAEGEGEGEEVDELGARFGLLIGGRALDDEDTWDPLEDHGVIGVEFAAGIGESPIDWELGVMASASEKRRNGIDLAAELAELYGGVTWNILPDARVVPYLGLGASIVTARAESTDDVNGGHITAWDDDSSLGGYAHAGIRWMVTEGFAIGLDYRALRGSDIRLFQDDGDADYDQLALVFSGLF